MKSKSSQNHLNGILLASDKLRQNLYYCGNKLTFDFFQNLIQFALPSYFLLSKKIE